jgi:hypothetical protein
MGSMGQSYSIYGPTVPWAKVLRDASAVGAGGVALKTAAVGTIELVSITGGALVFAAAGGGYAAGTLVNACMPESAQDIAGEATLGSLQTIGFYRDLPLEP